MKKIAVSIPTSLGEIINIKAHLEDVKHEYSEIRLNFKKSLWNSCLHTEAKDWPQKKVLWDKYLNDIGQLFFSEPPYVLDQREFTFYDCGDFIRIHRLTHRKAEMAHLLCKGTSLNIGDYIVITTKARQLDKKAFFGPSIRMWDVLRKLSTKYKIVVLGEREVEMRKEYDVYENQIFGIYDQIIANLPAERIVDLTVPALGETVSDLKQIQQDCLIMNEAKFTVTLGVGGNFCMATSVSKMAIGFRTDNLAMTNRIFNRDYPNAIITKDWAYFIRTLEKYL
jgi:hypothetical protein